MVVDHPNFSPGIIESLGFENSLVWADVCLSFFFIPKVRKIQNKKKQIQGFSF